MSSRPPVADEAQLKQLRMVWVVFLGTTITMIPLALFVGSGEYDLTDDIVPWTAAFLCVLAGIQLLTVFLLKPMVAGMCGGKYQTYCVLRWAMLESISVYGLLLILMGMTWLVPGILMVAAVGAMFLVIPSAEEADSFAELAR